jgi:hypothetical protein
VYFDRAFSSTMIERKFKSKNKFNKITNQSFNCEMYNAKSSIFVSSYIFVIVLQVLALITQQAVKQARGAIRQCRARTIAQT